MLKKLGWPSWPQWRQLPKVLTKKERMLIWALVLGTAFFGVWGLWASYLERTVAIPAAGGTYAEALVGEPKFINPILLGVNDVDRDIAALVYTGLMKYDGSGSLVPDLAERYEVSEDGKEYTFFVRKNAQWHDGRLFSADDVIFTISAILNPEYASPLRQSWIGISVEKIADDAVKFVLQKPYAQFPERLTVGMLPKHIWEDIVPGNIALADTNLKPVGTGPYRFAKFTKDRLGTVISYSLDAYERFYRGVPFISHIIFSFYPYEEAAREAYQNGKVMGIGNVAPDKREEVEKRGGVVHLLRAPKYYAVFFNYNRSKALVDKNVRTALAQATDKSELVSKVLAENGTVIDSPLLPWMRGAMQEITRYAFSPDQARELLEKAGWKDKDGDGAREKILGNDKEATPLEFTLATSDFSDLMYAGEVLKQQWEQIGARVHLETYQIDDLKQLVIKPRKYEALLFGEALSLAPDPYQFWHSSQKKDPGLNLSLYDNKEVDKLLEGMRESLSSEEREAQLKKFQEIIADELPALFLFSPYYLYAQDEDVEGMNASVLNTPARRFNGIEKWYLKTKRIEKEQ